MRYTFEFDNGFIGSGLAFDFTRSCSGTNYDGTDSAPNTPRYAPETLIFGSPEYVSIDATVSTTRNIHSAGRRRSGQPYFCYLRYGVSTVEFIVANGVSALENITATTDKYTFSLIDENKDSLVNMLVGQTGTFGTVDIGQWCFTPKSVRTFGDMIFVSCEVLHAPDWESSRIAVVYADMRKIVAGVTDPWTLWFIDDATSADDTARGSDWSFTITKNGNSAWIGLTDNVDGTKTGYRAIVARIDYNAVSDAYTLNPPTLLDSISGYSGMSAHFVYNTLDYPANKLRTFISIGDSYASSHMVMKEIDKDTQYWSEATGIGGSGNLWRLFSPSSDWSARAIVHGTTGTSTLGIANQVMSVCAGPTPDSFFAGSRDTAEGIVLGTYDASKGQMSWRNKYIPAITANYGTAAWQFTTVRDENGWVYSTRAVYPSGTVGDKQSVIIASPDNEHFGVLANHKQSALIECVAALDKLYVGSATSAAAKGIIPGKHKINRPLVVAPTTLNYLTPTVAITSGYIGVNVAAVSSLPSNFPPPPCNGPIFEVIATSNAGISTLHGLWPLTPTSGIPGVVSGTWGFSAKGWYLNVPFGTPTGIQSVTGYTGKGLAYVGFRAAPNNVANNGYNTPQLGVSPDPTCWVPFTVRATTGTVTSTAQWGSGWRCDMLSRGPATACLETQYLVAFESVSINENLTSRNGHHCTASGSSELATVSGFSCGTSWSIGFAGMMHYDQYDHSELPTGDISFFRINDGAKSLSLFNSCISNGTNPATGTIGINVIDSSLYRRPHVGSNANILRGVPVTAVMNYATGNLEAYYCIANDEIQKFTVTGLNVQPKSIVFGDQPIAVFGGGVSTDSILSSGEVNAFFRTLEFPISKKLTNKTTLNANASSGYSDARGVVKGGPGVTANVNRSTSDAAIGGVSYVTTSGFIPTSGSFTEKDVVKGDFRINRTINDTAAGQGKRAVFRSGHRNIVDSE